MNEVSTHTDNQLDDLLEQSVEWGYSSWTISEMSAGVRSTFKPFFLL